MFVFFIKDNGEDCGTDDGGDDGEDDSEDDGEYDSEDDGEDDGEGDGVGEDSTEQPVPTCTNPYHPIRIILTLSNPLQREIVSPSVPILHMSNNHSQVGNTCRNGGGMKQL